MKQNINFTLLGLLVAVLIAMIAMNIYYQGTYTTLADEYKESLKEKNNLSKELAASQKQVLEKEGELNEKIKNLNLSVSEISKFEDMNENLSEEIKKIDFESIDNTVNELKSEIDSIENATLRNELNNKINALDKKVFELENRISAIKEIVEA